MLIRICLESAKLVPYRNASTIYLDHNLVEFCNVYSSRSIKISYPLSLDVANSLLVTHVKSLCYLFTLFIDFLASVILYPFQNDLHTISFSPFHNSLYILFYFIFSHENLLSYPQY